MRYGLAISALLVALASNASAADTKGKIISLPSIEASTSDYDGMRERRLVRILVVPNKTLFFLEKGEALGVTAETGRQLETWINKRHQKGPYKINVGFVPTTRDRIFQDLREGKGDIAAANLTNTPERSALVDFAEPWIKNVKEILVTGPSAPPIATINDLAGRNVMARKSSSYYSHIVALNERFKREKRKPIKIIAADEVLEDEDLLQMVSAGLLQWAIVDEHTARLWTRILKGLSIRKDIVFNDGGEIGWAIRKNNPLLQRELKEFVTGNRKFADDLIAQYIYDGKVVRNALAKNQLAKYLELLSFFKTYGQRYGIDPYMLAAQGYQESALDQKLRMKSGAVGIMQMMPSTAREELGINDIVTRAEDNIHSGAAYLRFLIEKYLDDPAIAEREKVLLVLAAYNAGPGNLKRFREKAQNDGFDPNIWFGNVEYGAAAIVGQETVQYVGNIHKYFVVYSSILPQWDATGADKPKK
jgi:membrane-bound lytic murein transglycosylase MltF